MIKKDIERIPCSIAWAKIKENKNSICKLLYKEHRKVFQTDYTYVGNLEIDFDHWANVEKTTVNFWRKGRPEEKIYPADIDLKWLSLNDNAMSFLANKLGLENYKASIQTLKPGKCIGAHYDEVSGYHSDMLKENSLYLEQSPDKILNIYIMFLTEWTHGQAFMIGKDAYMHWSPGDIISFPWYMEHSTVNASAQDRTIIYIVGTKE